MIRKPETAQQKPWLLIDDFYVAMNVDNASESDFESPGCDCSDGLIPDRGGRHTRMRSWEAGADREMAG